MRLLFALLLVAAPASANFGTLSTLFPSDHPDDLYWHLDATGVRRAHARFASRGEGVLIAQPDTGWVPHPGIPTEALELELGFNFLTGEADALDDRVPRDGPVSVPGHCTQAQGLILSPRFGIAPDAHMVPLKVSHGVILFDARPLVAAIDHAVEVGADVISIAQGMPFYDAELHAAVRRATDAGAIVVAAAGNVVPFVVYPAAFPEVIAVGGVTPEQAPFRFSSAGPQVDVVAPGAEVTTTWVSRALLSGAPRFYEAPSYGTTLASAQVAGIAALWLSEHPDARAQLGPKTAATFRAAAQKTARRPAGWRTDAHGAGIVDAEALLALPLAP